jgi:hypothetical protein
MLVYSLFVMLTLFHCPVYCDIAVDIVFLIDPSVFPIVVYESILQQVSNLKIASASVLKLDTIVGAEARLLYFPNSTSILRFQLVHVTRIHSQLSVVSGDSSAAAMAKLRAFLVDVVLARIGVCGIDGIFDTDVGASNIIVADDGQWYSGMPLLLAPVALIGWMLTLLLCAICWVCVCYSNKTVPSAEVVVPVVEDPSSVSMQPAAFVVPFAPPIVKSGDVSNSLPLKRGYSSHSLLKDRVSSQSDQAEISFRRPANNPYSGGAQAEFPAFTYPVHSINERGIPIFLDMRLPSFA